MKIQKWKQCKSKVVGVSHQASHIECQDYTFSRTENGVMAIALADGAGSKKLSALGAEIITKKICHLLVENFNYYFQLMEKNGLDEQIYQKNLLSLKELIRNQLMSELNLAAKKKNIAVEELSSTLLFFAMKDDHYLYGHIGDGAIGAIFTDESNREVQLLSAPENGPTPNITFFLPDLDAIDHLRLSYGKNPLIRGVILMSDGPSEVLFDKHLGFNENAIKLFDNFRLKTDVEYEKLLESFLSKTIATFSDDDLSLALLYKETISKKEKIKDDYLNYLLKDIHSKKQVVEISEYTIYLKPFHPKMGNAFSSVDDVRRYIKW